MQVFPDGLFFTVPHGMAFIKVGENRDHWDVVAEFHSLQPVILVFA
jgi:hypothetical protein